MEAEIIGGGRGELYHQIKPNNGLSTISNEKTIKSMEAGSINMRKFHLMNYITELQKDKVVPTLEKSEDLLILTEY